MGQPQGKVPVVALRINYFAWRRLTALVNNCDTEINGFGYIKRLDWDTLYIDSPEDIFITEQTASRAHVGVDEETVGRAIYRADQEGRSGDLRFQWHSHVDGGVVFSTTDTNNIEDFGEAGAQWMVSMVLNRRGDAHVQLDVFTPFRAVLPVQVHVAHDDDAEFRAGILAEIAANVKPPLAFFPAHLNPRQRSHVGQVLSKAVSLGGQLLPKGIPEDLDAEDLELLMAAPGELSFRAGDFGLGGDDVSLEQLVEVYGDISKVPVVQGSGNGAARPVRGPKRGSKRS